MPKINFKEFLKKRPISWSAISSWEYNPDEWYRKYILKEPVEENMAMIFGKKFAKSVEDRKPMVPVEIYKEVEYSLKVMFSQIPLVGFIDTYEPHTKMREFKTARQIWSKEKAEQHGQLKMYALMLYCTHKVKPEDLTIHLDCIQTRENSNFSIEFMEPVKIHSYEVRLSMKDILLFGSYIIKTVNQMEKFVESYPQ